MKKWLLSLLAVVSISLVGCFETTEEVTLNEDGSGTYINVNDMSKVIPIMKNMGAGMDQLGGKKIDSSFAMGASKENLEGLTEEDATLLKKGTMNIKIDADDEQMLSKMTFPFASLNEIPRINKVAAKSMLQSIMGQMSASGGAAALPPGMEMPEPSSISDYYVLEFENGELKRKLNKEKHATLASDKYLEQLQQAGSMGIPITYTTVFNLPRPAEKVEGKNVKLSEDKKKVTVSGTIDDLFDNPEKMEFKIKY